MLPTTANAVRSILTADPSLTPADRARLLAAMRNGAASNPEPAAPRILSRRETARRLGRTLRTVDNLAAVGALRRIVFPGRKRAAGFRESDVIELIGGTV